MYDAKIARFLQADPMIQDPLSTQSLNRYSYVWNNPLNATDPTGFISIKQIVSIVVAIVVSVVTYGAALGWAAGWGLTGIAQTAVAGAIAGGFAGFAGGLITGGIKGALRGALNGAISGAAFGALGGSSLGGELSVEAVLAYGAVGGITSVLQGGKFGHGFLSAGISAIAGGAKWVKSQVVEARALIKAVIGGTISEITGGKFVNGAVSAAFSELFSSEYSVKSQEAKRAARAAACAYDGGDCSGFRVLNPKADLGIDAVVDDPASGFQAKILEDDQGTIISFRGTDEGKDWGTNIPQGVGRETKQYELAIKLATDVKSVVDGNLLLTGHSLGGGLASAASIVTNTRAITFNAAGLHAKTVARYGANISVGTQLIDAYYTSGDILSLLQDMTPMPNAAGNRIRMAPKGLKDPLTLHSQF
ncbi:RHS repeat-associated core domain-containing protein [Porticoccus sp. GXU_MW_L64]